jgi:hypothetical protein
MRLPWDKRGSVKLNQMPNTSPETLKGLSRSRLQTWDPAPLGWSVRNQAPRKCDGSHGRGDQHPVTLCRHSRARQFVAGLVGKVTSFHSHLPLTKAAHRAIIWALWTPRAASSATPNTGPPSHSQP